MSFSKKRNFDSSRQSTDKLAIRHTLNRLRVISEGLTSCLTGVGDLPIPKLDSLSDVKEFCSGLLINPTEHPWGGAFPCRRQRMTAAHSLFLFRKVIPSNEDPIQLSLSYLKKMTEPQSACDPRLISFAKSEVKKILRKGWDKGYSDRCDSVTLPVSACIENVRSNGGARGIREGIDWKTHDDGRRVLLSTPQDEVRKLAKGIRKVSTDKRVEVKTIFTGGKYRTVTVASYIQNALSPLHYMLYDKISEEKWLLRGDASKKNFSDFKRVEGEVFVSGDYESATDNIKIDLYSAVLDAIEESSPNVPSTVFEIAREYLDAELSVQVKEGVFRKGNLKRGQLMGNYLSFPILCMINYITFKYAVRRDVPVKINGDDIVFRSTKSEYEKWKEIVSSSGLKLSVGKTMVDREFFTLNSCLFQAKNHFAIGVPFVRAKALFKNPETGFSLKGQLNSIVSGWNGRLKRYWQIQFLLREGVRRCIKICQRSLNRGLGLNLTNDVLRQTGFYKWERFYSSAPTEKKLPIYGESGKVRCKPVPGFRSVSTEELTRGQRKKASEIQNSYFRACILDSKIQDFQTLSDVSIVRLGTSRFIDLGKGLRKCLSNLIRTFSRGRKVYADIRKVERTGASWMLPCQEIERPPHPGLGWKESDIVFDDV